MSKVVKVGDTVQWRGAWGSQAAQPAVVKGLELMEYEGQKEGGISVDEAPHDLIKAGLIIFDLDNGHWAYSSQIDL